ncbi:hypothetical protein [Aeromicrobium flavum]|uniref:hypothetical protein n=1 Tax=Aeromicrobium flavum TaxID=416568 RepID=UPI0031CE5BD9
MDGVSDPLKDVPALAGVAGPEQTRRARNWRRVGMAGLVAVVVLACLGWLGPREATASGELEDGASVEVTYPQITRPGAASALTVSVEDVSGPVTIELPALVLETLGVETISPAPATETATATSVRLTFDASPTGDFSVGLAGRMPTRSSVGAVTYPIRVGVAGAAPEEVASVKTWVLP